MPGRRFAGAAGVIDGKLYVAGGWDFPTLPTDTLQIYDPGADSWSIGPPLPHLSGSGAGGVIAGKLYVLTALNSCCDIVKFFDVFDPTSSSWTALPAPAEIHVNPASGVIGGKFYVVGTSNGSDRTVRLEVYDPGTNTWTTKAPMPTARTSPFGGVFDGKLYVAGGLTGAGNSNTVEVYDPGTDSWATMTPMPTARQGVHNAISSPAIDGKLYMVGGHDGTSNLATLEVFSPAVDIPPTAVAGPDQMIRVLGDTIILDGSASFDDNTASAALGYA